MSHRASHASGLLTSVSNIRRDTAYIPRDGLADLENGDRAARLFPVYLFRAISRTGTRCTNGDATNFAMIKTPSIRYVFFFLSIAHVGDSRATTREVTVIGFVRSLVRVTCTKCCCTHVDVHTCVLLTRSFYAGPTAGSAVPSSRKWKWNFASILCGNNACRPRDIPRSDLIWRRNKPDWHAAICSA